MDEQSNYPLWRFTTLKIGGEAQRFCQPTTLDEFVELMNQLKEREEPWFVLGGGSNLLISSEAVPGTVIRTARLTSCSNPSPNIVDAHAGARLPHLARYAGSLGLSGLEFSVGIPGTVGGGVIMNAGAHGSCMSNVLQDVTIFDTSKGEIVTLTNDELGFQYRKCNLDPKVHVVLSARFNLANESREVIEENIKHNEEYRWKTQPLGWPNAGSTFKNPEPQRGAGLLLDKAGAKNLREGQAAVSAVHANFVINMGGATSSEVLSLMARMQDCVYTAFEVRLHPEWKTLGTFSESEKEVWRS